jgi:hypothetical protein
MDAKRLVGSKFARLAGARITGVVMIAVGVVWVVRVSFG